jgi:RNA polymerase sigma-70 factor (ECF subfamily)
MSPLQTTSLKGASTRTVGALFRAPRRRSTRTRPVSQIRKSQASHGKAASTLIGKDCDLVQLAIAGSADAQERLFKTHTPRLYRTAYAVLRNKEDAEDAVQECWHKAYTNLDSFEGRSGFSTWLTRIAINSALMLRRKKGVRTESSLDEILDSQSGPLLDRIEAEQPNPEEICVATEMNALIEQQLRELTPGVEAAFRLREIAGYSTTESVQALGIHRSALKSRILRARRRLADALQRSILKPAPLQAALRGKCAQTICPIPGVHKK